jgi:hypothetical protein
MIKLIGELYNVHAIYSITMEYVCKCLGESNSSSLELLLEIINEKILQLRSRPTSRNTSSLVETIDRYQKQSAANSPET